MGYRLGEMKFREEHSKRMVEALDYLKLAEKALCEAHMERRHGLNREIDKVGEAIESLLKRKGSR